MILNGRVMDPETMFDAVRNVGIKGGKIAAITRDKIKGNETIDAKGRVVAPGFIDTHYHALDELAVKMGIRDAGEQGLPTSGIPYVIVNGQIVVKDSKVLKVWAGQPIRFPVEE